VARQSLARNLRGSAAALWRRQACRAACRERVMPGTWAGYFIFYFALTQSRALADNVFPPPHPHLMPLHNSIDGRNIAVFLPVFTLIALHEQDCLE